MNTDCNLFTLIIAIVLVFILPLWLVFMEIWSVVKQHRIRQKLLENKDNEQKNDTRQMYHSSFLNWGKVRAVFALLGVGIGVLLNYILKKWIINNFLFWITMAIGIGMGLFAAFILEIIITKKR
ncbi:MAG: hypothetical protein J6V13_07375 [Paludibacteraceae bacterium]|nr:hypothetical protein [Paludibacteraceae bacterium]